MLVDVASGALRPMTGATKYEVYPQFSPDGALFACGYPRDGNRPNGNELNVVDSRGGVAVAGPTGNERAGVRDAHVRRLADLSDGFRGGSEISARARGPRRPARGVAREFRLAGAAHGGARVGRVPAELPRERQP